MKINVNLPIIICVDNIGAIFMTKNITTFRHSKHVDICCKFVTEYIEDGIIRDIFVKSADSDSDVMTKNLGSELHFKPTVNMISMKDVL